MNRRYINLFIIIVLLGIAIYTVLPSTTNLLGKPVKTVLGLDLQGGMQIIMQVDPNFVGQFTQEQLETARQILESRANGLGVAEVTFQTSGTRYIIGELPGVTKSEQIIDVIKQTGQLEFVNFGNTPFEPGTIVNTSLGNASQDAINDQVYQTIMTGSDLTEATVGRTQLGEYEVQFTLTDNGQKIFSEYTAQNTGTYLGIVLDKKVISSPIIKTAITDKSGVISGGFTYDSANALAVQLRYGSLPLPLVVEQIRVIGPTLGQDSLDKSLIAGLIGFAIITLFMGIYYRVPGIVADLSLVIYATITLAIFRIIPVTITLPGIAGIMLSTGSALDANILFFERMKEELRAGRPLLVAIEIGWRRAWPSIRDSNISALITSLILFWFGSTFGASIVKGFAVTLALGVMVSVFTAWIVTRTLLTLLVSRINEPEKRLGWFGL